MEGRERGGGAGGGTKPPVVITFAERMGATYLAPSDLQRLEKFAEVIWLPIPGERQRGQGPRGGPPPAPRPELLEVLPRAEALVICHGAPVVDAALLERAPRLRFVGELEGDRFATRVDVEACNARGVVAVDTTNGSSYPVSEWALAMTLIALRNAGHHFRRMLAGEVGQDREQPGYFFGELTGKRVGLIGCGHIGRRFLEYLRPFRCEVRVYDPYLAPEVVDIYDLIHTSLELVFRQSDVVVCLAPLTPRTRGMIGAAELDWLQPNAAFVNVSRGPIVDSQALIERLKRGDGVRAALDVFDPEPIPADSEIRQLSNVFLTPHIAGSNAESRPRFFSLMVDELERFFQGYYPRYVLNERTLANRRGS
ncbi:MAG TPA: hydroxyacid dehydrogenase [Chloroflexota bacterium]|nr:hydroxyacid dehydrogenase [Chloroflexota bacterium]